ncbi:MAG TPA: peptide chain release factor 2 [Gemmatimonadota bacterium]
MRAARPRRGADPPPRVRRCAERDPRARPAGLLAVPCPCSAPSPSAPDGRTSGTTFDLASREARLTALEERMAAPDFWGDSEAAKRTIEEANRLRRWVQPWRALGRRLDDLAELEVLAAEDEGGAALEGELGSEAERIGLELDDLEGRSMLQGEDDARNAILTIHPGAGGVDSQDWASMLLRMYLRWIERRGFAFETLDLEAVEEGGIKRATIEVRGEYAYGYLRAEKGVHRLVRISPFDQNARRHTSFASVFVYPEVEEDITVEIAEGDLRVDTFRASGAGGQHVNKTSSAVRITHLPTGIVVQSQGERSQHRNREAAMKILTSRLYQYHKAEREKTREELESEKKEIAFGSQIRSYVFHPYTLVKDHRTGHETGDVQRVMDGDLDPFIEAYLKQTAGQALVR